jgi:hypothetical protein
MSEQKIEQKIRGGAGVRVSRYGAEHVISAPPRAWRWDPAWPVEYGGDFVTVGYGTVNGEEPVIKGVPISGDPKTGEQPRIKLEGFDSEDRAWVVVKVTADLATGKIAGLTVECVSAAGTSQIAGGGGAVGLHPLAVVTKRGVVHPVTFFHLRWALGYPPNDVKVVRHFFW